MLIEKKAKIFEKIDNNEPVKLSFKYASDDLLMLVNSIIAKFLSKHDMLYLLYSVLTIAREIIVNSLKANAKRIFFIRRGLNITDPGDYPRGIAMFKEQVVGDFELIRDDLQSSDYSINFTIAAGEKGFQISVKNNSPILPEEQLRINKRIAKAIQKTNFNELYQEIEDETEGAGLGIALVIMFLKNMGINPDSFKIRSDGNVTLTSVDIPYNLKPEEVTTVVKSRILHEIKGLPTFPENITTLLNLCSSPDATIDQIASRIKTDPSLTSDVIKLANSAGFITGRRIDDINMAVMKIGLKNVKSILIATSARTIMESRYTKFEEIWEHCNRTAVYSRLIADKFGLHGVSENAFLAGLLHDLGQVILLAVDMNSVRKIADIVHDRNIITTTVMEELSIGISHSEIGRLLSEKWNFPDFLTQSIFYHHAPKLVAKENRDITYTVYLANMLCGIEKRKYYYYYIDDEVLARFGIKDNAELEKLHSYLKKTYNS